MNIIVRVVTGVLQDASPKSNPYEKVTPVYVALSVASLFVSILLVGLYYLSTIVNGKFENIYIDIGRLQWTRKQRMQKGELMNARREAIGGGDASDGERKGEEKGSEIVLMRKISMGCIIALGFLVLGSWSAYFWGVATGNNS